MEQWKRVVVLCLFVGVLSAACAPMLPTRQFTPQDIDSMAREYATRQIEEWGLVKGSPREAKLHRAAAQVLSNESFQTAARKKPNGETWDEWESRLLSEGLTYLSDDTLRRAFGASSRMLNDATDAECIAFAHTAYLTDTAAPFVAALRQRFAGDALGPFAAVWRQRLARISEEDFDTLIQTQVEARLARSNRVNDPPAVLSPAEIERGMKSLEPHLPVQMSAQSTKELFGGVESKDPMAICTLARIIFTAKSRVSGPDASLGLRVFLDQGL